MAAPPLHAPPGRGVVVRQGPHIHIRHDAGVLCFFFSSRRRHTRLSCDWSSDVCSSDLYGDHRERRVGKECRSRWSPYIRSEERRVGKEGKTWGAAVYLKKKKRYR